MFVESTAIASLSSGRSKRDEETARDVQREQVYASMNDIQSRVNSCQLSAADGVAQAHEIVRQYYEFCDTFKNKSVSQSCRNYESQDYPGGAQQGAFTTRIARIQAGGGNCNKPAAPAPAVQATPITPIAATPVQIAPGPSGGPGCCGYNPGDAVMNVNGNVGFNWGGANGGGGGWGGVDGAVSGGAGANGGANVPARVQGILGTIAAAVDAAVHGGDSGAFSAADTSGYNSGYNSGLQVVDFPMAGAYDPFTDTGSPIAGMNVFPNDPVDSSAPGGVRTATFNKGETNIRPGAESMSGFGDDPPTIEVGDLGTVTTTWQPTPTYAQGIQLPNTGPSTLQSILGTIGQILPATISAIKGKPYYNTAQQANTGQFQTGLTAAQIQQSQPGAAGANIGAQAGAAVGNIGDTISNIVAQNPLLVLGGVAAVVLLFMEKPGRR